MQGPRRGEWLPGQRPRACADSSSGAEMKDSPSTEISSRLPPVVPMRADEEVVLAGQVFDLGEVAGIGGDEHGGGRLGEEAEERMGHEATGPARRLRRCRSGMRPEPGQRRCRRRRCRGRSGSACARRARPAACAGWLRLRDRARAACPRCRRGRPWHTPKSRRR